MAKKTGRARSVTEAYAHTFLMNKKACVSPLYEESGTGVKENGPVTLGSGGLGVEDSELINVTLNASRALAAPGIFRSGTRPARTRGRSP